MRSALTSRAASASGLGCALVLVRKNGRASRSAPFPLETTTRPDPASAGMRKRICSSVHERTSLASTATPPSSSVPLVPKRVPNTRTSVPGVAASCETQSTLAAAVAGASTAWPSTRMGVIPASAGRSRHSVAPLATRVKQKPTPAPSAGACTKARPSGVSKLSVVVHSTAAPWRTPRMPGVPCGSNALEMVSPWLLPAAQAQVSGASMKGPVGATP